MKTRTIVLLLLTGLLGLTGCIPNTTQEASVTERTQAAPVAGAQTTLESSTTTVPDPTPTAMPTSVPTPTVTLAPTATPATPQPSSSSFPAPPDDRVAPFELGGHIGSWDNVQEMQYAGMTWAKVQVHYPNSSIDFIRTAHDNGFKIQLTGLGNLNLAGKDTFIADYAAWAADMAAAGANAIEVWTEPNIDREWPVGQISPEAYTELLCAAYGAIKAANPDTLVISAAPAPTGYFDVCDPNGCNDVPFLEGMVDAGASACLDYVGAHHNSGATSPMAQIGHPAMPSSTHHSWYFTTQTDQYFEVFNEQRQLFYTEMGYASQEGVATFSDPFAWAKGTTNAQQASWLTGAVNLGRSTGKVYAIMVWNMNFARYGLDPQDGYAIIRPDGACPACDALHNALVRTTPPPDQDFDTLRLPWAPEQTHCILPESPPEYPDGLSFDMLAEPVLAAHSGWVIEVGEDPALATKVLLCRGQDAAQGECSLYGHLTAASVVEGQYAERGQEIALSDDMLFFVMQEDGTPVPAAFDEMEGGTSLQVCYVSQNTP